jgi:ABC-type bacteriocin/lantibiotic exporter with double-glycine peptidase domain
VHVELHTLRRQAGTTLGGTSLEGLAEAARANGLRAEGVQVDGNALTRLDQAAIAWVDGDHYVAVLSVEGGRATIHDPNHAREEVITTQELWQRSGGILLLLSR